MAERLVIVDYEAGNLHSVERAVAHLGASFATTSDAEQVAAADRLIFPGVGECASAMAVLRRTGMDQALREVREAGRPMLGICVGCQVVFERSAERDAECMGLLAGSVLAFRPDDRHKVPHMGWNQVRFERPHPLVQGIPDRSMFYFVHSYYPAPASTDVVVGSTTYGLDFGSIIADANLAATQFHAEKSGRWGLQLLENFLSWRP